MEHPSVFICHATEDKEDIVEPLVNLLKSIGLKVFYDKDANSPGDDINIKIQEGLSYAKVGVVIFSEAFLEKDYAKAELAVLHFKRQQSQGILLTYCYKINHEDVLKKLRHLSYILLSVIDKHNLNKVAEQIHRAVKNFKPKINIEDLLEDENQVSSITPFDKSKDNYDILILTFNNPERNFELTSLGKNLEKGLNARNITELNIQYHFMDNVDITSDLAREIGKKAIADLVVWGDHYTAKRKKPHTIIMYYTAALPEDINKPFWFSGKTDKHETNSLFDITEGSIQLEIEDVIYWFMGRKFLSQLKFEKALENFRKIKTSKRIDIDLYMVMGLCYSFCGNHRAADKFYKKSLQISPENIPALNSYGHFLEGTYRYNKAKKCFNKVIALDAQNLSALRGYANCLYEQSNYIDAKKLYLKLISIYPDREDILVDYAKCLMEETDYDGTIDCLDQALGINPKSSYSHNLYAHLMQYHLKDIENAKKHFMEALNIDDSDYFTHMKYALLLLSEDYKNPEVRAHYVRAIELNPYSSKAHSFYASLLEMLKDMAGADEHYKKAILIDPKSPFLWFYYYQFLKGQKKYIQATLVFIVVIILKTFSRRMSEENLTWKELLGMNKD